MLTPGEIKALIDNDTASEKKRLAREGQNYYEGVHDIKDYRVFFIDADGQVQEDKTKSNIKICHPFLTELIDQKVQYMLSGKDRYIKSDIPELQDELDDRFNYNDEFNSELHELLTGSAAKGIEYMYAYKGEDEKTSFQCADSLGVVEVRKDEAADGCDYVIYHYIDRIGKDNKKVKRIQVWDQQQTYYYCQIDDGAITLDESVEINPRPHIIYKKDGDEHTYFDGFGFIPFFPLPNCRKQFSDLKPVKALIDDYDLMSCGLSNNIQDTNEALYVVKGFQGDNLDELMVNVKAKKHIGVDEEGGVEIKTIDIPYQARQAKLELDEKNIYRFGMGFNSAQVGDGNITNIIIKSRYALLDLKCNKLEIRLKQFFRKLLKVVIKEINEMEGADYRLSDVYFDFQREVMTNAADNAQIELTDAQKQEVQIRTLLNLATYLDNETLMQNICAVLDLDYDDLKDKLPKPETNDPYATQTALDALRGGGGVIE
ncbi:MAG: phage portal protein [Clostridia bacterium]|nr:phage portal protein [Clostridia bacterium]